MDPEKNPNSDQNKQCYPLVRSSSGSTVAPHVAAHTTSTRQSSIELRPKTEGRPQSTGQMP